MPVIGEIDPENLAEAGWGIVLAADADSHVLDALSPLIEHRQGQTGGRVGILTRRPDEDGHSFLARYGTRLGVVDPRQGVPYYLLLIGNAEAIPFEFQKLLSVFFAVGRLDFPSHEEYRYYAESVVKTESTRSSESARVAFFCPDDAGDPMMQGAHEYLLRPVAEPGKGRRTAGYGASLVSGGEATKQRLGALLGGRETPSLLMAFAHGVVFPSGHDLQRSQQGGIVCRRPENHLTRDTWFSAEDVGDEAQLSGVIAFLMGSFSAATPRVDSLGVQILGDEVLLAPQPFVSRLPQRLLGHPNGGALAVIGQTDRVSVYGPPESRWKVLSQFLRDAGLRLWRGSRLGEALSVNQTIFPALATKLEEEIHKTVGGEPSDDNRIAESWTGMSMVRSVVILGDPAVRLMQVAD